MKNIMDRVAIEDAWYTKAFWDEVENAPYHNGCNKGIWYW